MLELLDETLDIKFQGEVYKIKFPTMGESKKLKQEIEEMGEDKAMINFFSKLGLKEEVLNKMTPQHVTAIVEALQGKKK
jgi:hypothetical protein